MTGNTHICPGCKTECGQWPYPYMATETGECWHLYCYHMTIDTTWKRIDEDGTTRNVAEAEIIPHREWAARTFPNPLADRAASKTKEG